MTIITQQLLPDLWRFADSCNVFVVKKGEHAIAVDFGSGQWLERLPDLGIQHLDHVFLTHHHADQCAGLRSQPTWPFTIHAPAGEDKFLDPTLLARGTFRIQSKGCPDSYAVLKGGVGVPGVLYDMAGFTDYFGATTHPNSAHPGHGPNACSGGSSIMAAASSVAGDPQHTAVRRSGNLITWSGTTGRERVHLPLGRVSCGCTASASTCCAQPMAQ